jgi:hypothetical protein
MKPKRAESKAMVAAWQANANQETKKDRLARLAKHEAGTVLTSMWGGADSFETRWMDLEALIISARELQNEVETLIGAEPCPSTWPELPEL